MVKLRGNSFKLVFSLIILLVYFGAVYGNSKITRKLSAQTGGWNPTRLSNYFAIIASSCTSKLCSILGHINKVSNIYLFIVALPYCNISCKIG